MRQLSVDDVEPAQDQRQHVVEVVRDAACELAERLHLLGSTQLLLETPLSVTSRALTTTRRASPSRTGTAVATASIVDAPWVRS